MPQRHVDLRGGGRLGPAEELQRVGVRVRGGDAVVGEDLLGEVEMLLRDHLLEHLGEFIAGHIGVHALVLVRDHDVHAVGMVADVLVDPGALDLQLFGREADRTEHPEAAGPADGDDDVAAVSERKDRELDAELVTERGVHGDSLQQDWNVF